jgi:hypothetical protein
MQRLFALLSEKDSRCYAAIGAAKLNYEGIEYVTALFEMDPKTVWRGLTELEFTETLVAGRIRKKRRGPEILERTKVDAGGKLLQTAPGIPGERSDAGRVLLTKLSRRAISRRLREIDASARRHTGMA